MEFESNGESALGRMSEVPFDAIVTDMRMPGMDGAELLQHVRERHPGTVRIILSGQSDQESVFRAIGPAHQYLSKPTSSEELKSAIIRAFTLRDHLANPAVLDLVGEVEYLPVLSGNGARLVDMLQNPDTSLEEIAGVISQDVGLTAKVLQLANSPYFGLSNPVSDPAHAVAMLGLTQLRPLVLSACLYSEFKTSDLKGCSVDAIMDRSLAVGGIAKKISAQESSDAEVIDQSMVAGMLHDVGKILLIDREPDRYSQAVSRAEEKSVPVWTVEQEIFGATHAEIGAYLLSLWGFPAPVVEAVAFHHQPHLANLDQFAPLVAVHVASVWAAEAMPNEFGSRSTIDESFLSATGVLEKLDSWASVAGVTAGVS